jgi:peptidyl-prolyl cis-trans isomerase-like protein 2
MVKRQKEKQYQSAREYRENSQLRASSSASAGLTTTTIISSSRLPFSHCALSLRPCQYPICHRSTGILLDAKAVYEYFMQYGIDPITKQKPTMKTTSHLVLDKDYIRLIVDKHPETGEWQCPILAKPFSNSTKIVAIEQHSTTTTTEDPDDDDDDDDDDLPCAWPRAKANVYSHEAYHRLNVQAKNYHDLISGAPFTKAQVMVLYDPDNSSWQSQYRRTQQQFFIGTEPSTQQQQQTTNLKDSSKSRSAASTVTITTTTNQNIQLNPTAARILEKLQKQKTAASKKQTTDAPLLHTLTNNNHNNNPVNVDYQFENHDDDHDSQDNRRLPILISDVTGVAYTDGHAASALTSTTTTTIQNHPHSSSRLATPQELWNSQFRVLKRLGKKGYVQFVLDNNHGSITVELYCDRVPKTCTNFLGLCEMGAYNDTVFHRLIPGFMIQGGGGASHSSKGTKRKHPHGITASSGKNQDEANGEEDGCLWGGSFEDEFDVQLTHSGRGVVCMANSGPHTNRRQFFITFQSCPHLDRKHSVFGTVVNDTAGVLKKLEQIPTDSQDRPKEEIRIVSTHVLENPALQARAIEQGRFRKLIAARTSKDTKRKSSFSKNPQGGATSESNRPIEVGKYLKVPKSTTAALQSLSSDRSHMPTPSSRIPSVAASRPGSLDPSKKKKSNFGDFSSW